MRSRYGLCSLIVGIHRILNLESDVHAFIPILVAGLAALSPTPRFPAAGPTEAWSLLPRENPPLPAWARVLVKSLPRTTGAMLELDYLHRAENPLGAKLAAKLRWLAADAIGSDYARESAMADLLRAHPSSEEVRRLVKNQPSEEEKGLFAFARQMTTAAYLITDGEFARLLEKFSAEQMTAIVHTLAYSNFHNRIILALGVKTEPGGSCPPLAVKLDRSKRAGVPTPVRPNWDLVASAKPTQKFDAPADWKDVGYAELEEGLANQKDRKPRLPLPHSSRFENLPASTKRQAETIVWMTVSAGYQPKMTDAWFSTFGEFSREAKQNRVFSSSVFWIVTRSNDCFY